VQQESKPDKTSAREPQPGEWLAPEDFAHVIRLTPLISIDIIARLPDGSALVGRRTNEPAKGVFFVPGGRISKNESKAAAFERIARDELGIQARMDQARFLGAFEHFYGANRFEQRGYGTHYIVLAYELPLTEKPDRLPLDQHGEYAWFTPAEMLARHDVHENTKAYFRNHSAGW
jgi:colanic acid biosynthesis protein WcaH